MRKTVCILLALLLAAALTACDNPIHNSAASTTSAAFSTPAAVIADDAALSEFFAGEPESRIRAMAGAVCSFAATVQQYPESLTGVPDENFGWTYLYNLVVYNGVTCEGVSAARDGFTLTPEALEKLQRDTLGGAVWTDVGPDLAEYVSYDESRDLYTVRPGRPQSLGAYIESAAYREDAACAELTVVVYDAEKSDLNSAVAGRYLIDLRAVEGSEYGYIIAAFSTAE